MNSETVNAAETGLASDSLSQVSAASGSSLVKDIKDGKFVQLWFFGPLVLAVVMFLLMGTVFERRIEALWHRILEHRRALSSQRAVIADTVTTNNSLHAVKTPSQKTIASRNSETAGLGFTGIIESNDSTTLSEFSCANENERCEISEVAEIRKVIEIIGPTVISPATKEYINFSKLDKSTVP